MSVSIDNIGGIKRRAKVVADKNQIKEAYNKKLVKVAKEAHIDGFRKGKVPVQVIQQRFGKSILEEVAHDAISHELDRFVQDNKIAIVGNATLLSHNVAKDSDAEFEFEFEVYPEIELASFAGVELEVPVCEVNDNDIDAMLKKLSRQFGEWVVVDRNSRASDRINLDFEGFVNGEAFAGGKAEGFELELGSGNMIPGFEDGLIGKSKGDELDLNVTFPEDYHSKDLAGKPAIFKCKINAVEEIKLPAIDDALAEKLEVKEGGLEALKNQIRTNMQSQVVQALEQKTKAIVMEKLVELNEVEVPQALVGAEIEYLKNDMKHRMKQQYGLDKFPDMNFPSSLFTDQAKKRVKTGLLVAEIIQKDHIKLDQEKLDAYLRNIAVSYDDVEAFIKWVKSDKNMMSNAESYIMEQQVVDKLILDAKLNSKAYTYQELVDSLN
jgi:trigger factor